MINLVKDNTWLTEDKKAIKIEDMSTKDIKDAIHKIYKSNGTWRHKYLRKFENELRKRKMQTKVEQF